MHVGPPLQFCDFQLETGRLFHRASLSTFWLDATLLGDSVIPSQEVMPSIQLPFSSSILGKLLTLMEISLKHNYISSLLVVAGGFTSLHYSTLTVTLPGCLTTVALGPAETGKTRLLLLRLLWLSQVCLPRYQKVDGLFHF